MDTSLTRDNQAAPQSLEIVQEADDDDAERPQQNADQPEASADRARSFASMLDKPYQLPHERRAGNSGSVAFAAVECLADLRREGAEDQSTSLLEAEIVAEADKLGLKLEPLEYFTTPSYQSVLDEHGPALAMAPHEYFLRAAELGNTVQVLVESLQ